MQDAEGVTEGEEVTEYEVTEDPPEEAGGDQETVAVNVGQ